MGTSCALHLQSDSTGALEQAARAARREIARLEQRYSRYRPDSLVAEIHVASRAGGSIVLDDEAVGLMDYAFLCFEQSGGRFDITAGVLRHAWDFTVARLPTQSDIDRWLPLVGMHRLDWRAPVLSFPLPGVEIDLGGIVKEYASDRAATACAQAGVGHGVVDLGGDVAVIGPQLDGSLWRIGVRDPRGGQTPLAVIEIGAGGLASSGDYERYIEVDGRRYCHILNPRTGWPVRGLAAVTVAAESCLVAGSLCTMAMLQEAEAGDWLAAQAAPYLWVDVDGGRGGPLLADRRSV